LEEVVAVLEVRRLTKRYGSIVALDAVDFEVRPGEIVGFLGPNGAGKTTTMRAIMNLVALDEGVVSWDGGPVDGATRQRFGYMPAERGMYPNMEVRDHLVYYGRLSGLDPGAAGRAADGWLERLGLADRASSTIQSLSSGNQQRVQLSLTLLNQPELLVLDEPFSGLDPVAVEVLGRILREQVEAGTALLLSSHQLDLVADLCSAVVIVDQGRVVLRGDVAELRAASDVRYVDVEFVTPTLWRRDQAVSVGGDGRRLRFRVRDEVEASRLIGDAGSGGQLVSYSFSPPDLSEVFLEAVGRHADEAPAGAGVSR
jgi:ABC-2 type transport system ATP-binding protein